MGFLFSGSKLFQSKGRSLISDFSVFEPYFYPALFGYVPGNSHGIKSVSINSVDHLINDLREALVHHYTVSAKQGHHNLGDIEGAIDRLICTYKENYLNHNPGMDFRFICMFLGRWITGNINHSSKSGTHHNSMDSSSDRKDVPKVGLVEVINKGFGSDRFKSGFENCFSSLSLDPIIQLLSTTQSAISRYPLVNMVDLSMLLTLIPGQ
jgi:hypothetical protein